MPVYSYSQTAATNATADATQNWAEGMAPSAVNDSARAGMAAIAQYRDDIAGAIVTGGTATAYTVTSYSVYDTLAHMNGATIAFTPHATNGATVTLNVDGLGAKPLRTAPNVELQSNVLILGTPYIAVYNNSDAAWYLRGMGSNAYGIPLAGGMDFWGATAPSSAFAFPAGQAISRTTYATLFAIMGTRHGTGNGSTTFNLPDKTGRISAMIEASPTRLTTYFSGDSTQLGSVGGGESQTLGTSNLPAYTPAGSVPSVTVNSSNTDVLRGTQSNWANGSGATFAAFATGAIASQQITSTGTGTFSGTAQGGTSTPFRTVQPTIICNYIIRVI